MKLLKTLLITTATISCLSSMEDPTIETKRSSPIIASETVTKPKTTPRFTSIDLISNPEFGLTIQERITRYNKLTTDEKCDFIYAADTMENLLYRLEIVKEDLQNFALDAFKYELYDDEFTKELMLESLTRNRYKYKRSPEEIIKNRFEDRKERIIKYIHNTIQFLYFKKINIFLNESNEQQHPLFIPYLLLEGLDYEFEDRLTPLECSEEKEGK